MDTMADRNRKLAARLRKLADAIENGLESRYVYMRTEFPEPVRVSFDGKYTVDYEKPNVTIFIGSTDFIAGQQV
ncbi:hypothetical protein GCM10027082_24600 [Comamonas humi]